jgi:hypothetical protein
VKSCKYRTSGSGAHTLASLGYARKRTGVSDRRPLRVLH